MTLTLLSLEVFEEEMDLVTAETKIHRKEFNGFLPNLEDCTMIDEIISKIQQKWKTPRNVIYDEDGDKDGTILQCIIHYGNENVKYLEGYPFQLPSDMIRYWTLVKKADFYKDVFFGQWGLKIFNPIEALDVTREERRWREPGEIEKNELIIGKFYGDLDLLLLSCDQECNFGSIRLVVPMDPRHDWPIIASSLYEFLENYYKNDGNKYWGTNH